ncbi:hypothetical protein Tco_1484179 [Tanacetum coccineum]
MLVVVIGWRLVFLHDKLYVALSRGISRRTIKRLRVEFSVLAYSIGAPLKRKSFRSCFLWDGKLVGAIMATKSGVCEYDNMGEGMKYKRSVEQQQQVVVDKVEHLTLLADDDDDDSPHPETGVQEAAKKKKKKNKSKKKKEPKEQTDPPSIPVAQLFPQGNFPEG